MNIGKLYLVKILQLLYIFAFLALPKQVLAFGCTSNGVPLGGTGTYYVDVDLALSKDSDYVILSDLGSFTSCFGQAGFNDALRILDSSISSSLQSIGFTGIIERGGVYDMPAAKLCVWPDYSCSTNYPDRQFRPIYVKVGMKRSTINIDHSGITIPAGSEIARLTLEQRSQNSWGWNKHWVFRLKSDLVIPAYTCTVNNSYQTVILPSVKKSDLITHGEGAYDVATSFNFDLKCDEETSVSIQFDGVTMPGKADVLANSEPGNDGIGIQVFFNSTPVVYGQRIKVINSAQEVERIPFFAHYYYNGGGVSAGQILAVSTLTFTYN